MGRYSKKELKEAFDEFSNPETHKIIQNILDRTINGDKMTQAEIQRACSLMDYSIPQGHDITFNVYDYPVCNDYIFRKLYLVYIHNLDGRLPAHDAFGLVPIERKKKEIEKLNELYSAWLLAVAKFNHKEALLNDVASETNQELKQLNKLNEAKNLDYREFEEKKKAIALHSKYIYLTSKEFFEENQSDFVVAKFGSYEIEIDTHSLIHIMFRHYAGTIKQFDTQKSFHLDASINYKELPQELKKILEALGEGGKYTKQKTNFIPFKYNGKVYAIWTKPAEKHVKGKGKVNYVRLETFYPVQDAVELARIATDYAEEQANETLSRLIIK